MSKLESAPQKHLGQIPQAQFVPQAAEHDLENNIRRQFEEVEGSARALVRLTPTTATAEYSVAEFSAAVQVPESGRLAVRADHRCRGGTSEYRNANATSLES
jgi:hypothetical protein